MSLYYATCHFPSHHSLSTGERTAFVTTGDNAPWMPVLTNNLLSCSACQLDISRLFVIINRFSFTALVRNFHLYCEKGKVGSGGEVVGK